MLIRHTVNAVAVGNRGPAPWRCEVCGASYVLAPALLAKEKERHGSETCGKHTSHQRVSLNVINIVRKEGTQNETFAEALERFVGELIEMRKVAN